VDLDGVAITSATVGGTVTVSALSDGLTAVATLAVKVVVATSDPVPAGGAALPAGAATRFTGPVVAARAPVVVYPNAGVPLPPNLPTGEIHYRPGSTQNTLFEIAFQNDVTDVRVVARCTPLGGGCLYTPAPSVWDTVIESNRLINMPGISVMNGAPSRWIPVWPPTTFFTV
jgi:hypothetical protein